MHVTLNFKHEFSEWLRKTSELPRENQVGNIFGNEKMDKRKKNEALNQGESREGRESSRREHPHDGKAPEQVAFVGARDLTQKKPMPAWASAEIVEAIFAQAVAAALGVSASALSSALIKSAIVTSVSSPMFEMRKVFPFNFP